MHNGVVNGVRMTFARDRVSAWACQGKIRTDDAPVVVPNKRPATDLQKPFTR